MQNNRPWFPILGSVVVVFAVVGGFWKVSQSRSQNPETIGSSRDETKTSQGAVVPVVPSEDVSQQKLSWVGGDALGRKLTLAFAAFQQDQMNLRWKGSFAKSPLAMSWKADRNIAVREAKEALKRLPADQHPEFRAELLELLGALPKGRDEASMAAEKELSELLWSEFKARPVVSEDSPEIAVASAAFRSLVERTPDEASAIRYAVDGMSAQKNVWLRVSLVHALVEKFPDSEETLKQRLSDAGIPDPEKEMSGELH